MVRRIPTRFGGITMGVVIRVIDDPDCLVVSACVFEEGRLLASSDFDYEFPESRCYGAAFDRAQMAARGLVEDYQADGFAVELVDK